MYTQNLMASLQAGNIEKDYIESFWYDWFCSDASLHKRGIKLFTKLVQIVDSPHFDKNESYAWFKNNCPMVGSTYDDFRISDVKSGKVLYTVQSPSNRYGEKHGWEVYGSENGFREPLAAGSWAVVKKWFLNVENVPGDKD